MADSDLSLGARGLRLAKAAGRMAGIEISDARLLRVRSSVHVEFPRAGIVARVETSGAGQLAERQVRIARLLAERGAPAARLLQPERQPYFVEDGAVTLWQQLDKVAEPDFAALGEAVRALHDATRGPLPPDTPTCDPFRTIHRDLGWPSPWSESEEHRELRRLAGTLAEQWQQVSQEDPLGRVIVHGDAHQENAIVTKDGLVLIDLEDAGEGPASWDFAALKVGVDRYGLPAEDYRAFADGYGAEPGAWEGHAVMCRVYELLVTAWAMRCSAESPQMAEEARVRVAGLLGRSEERWTLV